jgi:hypothetical protein
MTAIKHAMVVMTLLFIAGSCGYPPFEPPDGIPNQSEMMDILFDIHLIEGSKSGQTVYGDTIPVDYYYEAIYRKYNITAAIFDSAMTIYSREPGILDAIYEKVIERLSMLEADIEALARGQQDPFNDDLNQSLEAPSDSLREAVERATRIFRKDTFN